MPKHLTFDVRYDSELAHECFGDGKELANNLRNIYHNKDLQFPDDFDSTQTVPPMHFLEVQAPDNASVEDLKRVQVPSGLVVAIQDFHL